MTAIPHPAVADLDTIRLPTAMHLQCRILGVAGSFGRRCGFPGFPFGVPGAVGCILGIGSCTLFAGSLLCFLLLRSQA